MARGYVHVEGNIYRRDGRYHLRKMVNGVRRWVALRTGNLQVARREAAQVTQALYQDRPVTDKTTFEEWWARYRQVYTVKKKAPWLDDQMSVRALEQFGRKRLKDIQPSDCRHFLTEISQTLSRHTVARHRGFLQAVFERAVEDQVIDRNPWKKLPKDRPPAKDRVLTMDEQLKLLSVMTPYMQRWVVFMLGTGLRIAEACAITPARIIDGNIHVPGSAAKGGQPRTVPVWPKVEATIQVQLEECGELWNATPGNYRKELGRYCVKAGIPHLSPHALRHTFATRFIEHGGDLFTLKEMLGDETVSATMKRYGRRGGVREHGRTLRTSTTAGRVLPFRRETE